MKRELMRSAVIIALVLAAGLVRADFSRSKWELFKDLSLPAPGPHGFVAVQVDGEVADYSRPDLHDLRLLSTEGVELPYVIVTEHDEVSTVRVPARIVSAETEGESQTLTLDLGSPTLHNRIEIDVSDHNFRRPLTLYGSDDGKTWTILRDGLHLFDFTGRVHVLDHRFSYDPTDKRFIKIEIKKSSVKAEDFKIIDARVYLSSGKLGRRNRVPVTIGESKQNAKDGCTDLIIDLGHANQDLDRLVFTTSSPEFQRRVEVWAGPDYQRLVGSGVIHRYHGGDFQSENLSVPVKPGSDSRLLVKIYDYDSPPLEITGVEGVGPLRVLVFRPTDDGGARLYYGNPKARKPVYDLAVLYPRVTDRRPLAADAEEHRGSIDLPLCEAGPQKTNPDYTAPPPPKKPLLPPKVITWLILIPAALVLVFLLVRSFRSIGSGKEQG